MTGAGAPAHGEPEGGVLVHRLPRQQAEMLEHHGDARRRSRNLLAEHRKLAGAYVDEAGDAAQEGGLAAAARADDAQDFLVAHVERELAESDDGAVEKHFAGIAHTDREIRLRDGHARLPEREAVSPRRIILLA
jgi:hypothetical protein